MLRFVRVTALLLVALALCTVAFGDDLYPPWWRGQPGTTFEKWEFSTNNPVTPPEPGYVNPYGVPSAHAWPGTSQNWVDLWGGRQGMWPLSGTIEATIPNSPQVRPDKLIYVQLTWAKQVPSSLPVVWDLLSGVHGTVVRQVVLGPTGYPSPNDFWYATTFLIHLQPNPSQEIVKIDGTLVVDEMVVDTICAPEPSSLVALFGGLISLAGFGSLRKRR